MGQLYYRGLHRYFFEQFPRDATEFVAVSGYVGPAPIRTLRDLPFSSSIVYGLQREKPDLNLHNALQNLSAGNVKVLYPSIPTHAKIYVWLNDRRPIRALVGSANFSENGLFNDFRETLIEVDKADLFSVYAYTQLIVDSSKDCKNVTVDAPSVQIPKSDSCDLVLYDPKSGEVQQSAGLNWGFSPKGNVRPNDAYIPIRTHHIKDFPGYFNPVVFDPQKGHKSRKLKEANELVWDDGVTMKVLFEGSQPVDSQTYPKQISSVPEKDILGIYLRKRLGLKAVSQQRNPNERVSRRILSEYGRDYITLRLVEPGVFFADFRPLHLT